MKAKSKKEIETRLKGILVAIEVLKIQIADLRRDNVEKLGKMTDVLADMHAEALMLEFALKGKSFDNIINVVVSPV